MLSPRMLLVGVATLALTACGPTAVPAKTSMVTAAPSTITQTRTVAPPSPPLRQSMQAWWDKVQDHVRAIQSATDAVSAAAQANDVGALNTACAKYHDVVAGLQGHMPPPDPAFGTEFQAGLSDYDVAMHFCLSATNDIDANELRHLLEFLRSGNAAMGRAGAILDQVLGASGQMG